MIIFQINSLINICKTLIKLNQNYNHSRKYNDFKLYCVQAKYNKQLIIFFDYIIYNILNNRFAYFVFV